MERNTLAAITIVGVSILIGVSPVMLDNLSLEKNRISFNSSVTVHPQGENETDIGVNADPTLAFGRIPMTASYTKYLKLEAKDKAKVDVGVDGNISSQISVKRESFFIRPGNMTVGVAVKPEESGYYEGQIHIDTKTPAGTVGSYWLDVKKKFDSLLNGLN